MNIMMFLVLSAFFLVLIYFLWVRKSFYSKAELVNALKTFSDPGMEAESKRANQLTGEDKSIE